MPFIKQRCFLFYVGYIGAFGGCVVPVRLSFFPSQELIHNLAEWPYSSPKNVYITGYDEIEEEDYYKFLSIKPD